MHDSYESASRAAARTVARTVSESPDTTLLLPTGSTPRGMYRFVDADPTKTHVLDAAAPDPGTECGRYEAAIQAAGGVDLCVLGIGRNGHIGFNEPGAPFSSRTRAVGLAESTRRANAAGFRAEEAPERAITVGMRTIFESAKILLLASGTGKAEAVAAAVEGGISPRTPASMLRHHPDVTFLLNREADSALGREVA